MHSNSIQDDLGRLQNHDFCYITDDYTILEHGWSTGLFTSSFTLSPIHPRRPKHMPYETVPILGGRYSVHEAAKQEPLAGLYTHPHPTVEFERWQLLSCLSPVHCQSTALPTLSKHVGGLKAGGARQRKVAKWTGPTTCRFTSPRAKLVRASRESRYGTRGY